MTFLVWCLEEDIYRPFHGQLTSHRPGFRDLVCHVGCRTAYKPQPLSKPTFRVVGSARFLYYRRYENASHHGPWIAGNEGMRRGPPGSMMPLISVDAHLLIWDHVSWPTPPNWSNARHSTHLKPQVQGIRVSSTRTLYSKHGSVLHSLSLSFALYHKR